MDTSRRDLLKGLTALGVGAGCVDGTAVDGHPWEDGHPPTDTRLPEPETWEGTGVLDVGVFPLGVRAGDATTGGVLLHTNTTASLLTLVVMAAVNDTGWEEVQRLTDLVPTEGVVAVELSGLTSDSAYNYAFFDEEDHRSRVGRFRTAVEDEWRVLTIGATSCLGDAEPTFECLQTAAGRNFDFFCFLGDFVYADRADELSEYREFHHTAIATPSVADLLASTSVIATWDDHEVDNNWLPGETDAARIDAARQAFGEALPARVGGGKYQIWRKLSWGDVADVFVLECRGERVRDTWTYLSREQMDWFKSELASSEAKFKIVLNSVPIIDFSGVGAVPVINDRWEGYAEQRTELLQWIANEGITGLLWISGDLHFGTVARLSPVGQLGDDQFEVLAGPAGSFLNPVAAVWEPDDQFVSFTFEWNYTVLTLDPGTGDVGVEFVGPTGEVLDQLLLGGVGR